jgi:glyoxylase-like metal-dependent hydrolase (beta-lactamase superfamily II)
MYTIKPIFHGMFKDHEKTGFTWKKDPCVVFDAPCLSYLVEGNNKTILVDSGPPNPDRALSMNLRPLSNATFLQDELKRLGMSPKQVDAIILTHLHWDHSYNLELFPGKPIYIQKRELQYAVAPLPSDARTYPRNLQAGNPGWFDGFLQMVIVDGDYDLMEGIRLLFLPGHSPGLQGVLVNTKDGNALIASDAFPLYENFEEQIPAGNHVDLREWYDSYEKAKKICDFILPVHDPKVLDRKVYG